MGLSVTQIRYYHWHLDTPGAMIAREICAPGCHCCHASYSHLCMVGTFLSYTEGGGPLCLYLLVCFSQYHWCDSYPLVQPQTFFGYIFYQSFYCLAMCMRVAIGDRNTSCLTQSRLLSFLSEIVSSMSIWHISSQKKTWEKFAEGHRGCLERYSPWINEIYGKSLFSFTGHFHTSLWFTACGSRHTPRKKVQSLMIFLSC